MNKIFLLISLAAISISGMAQTAEGDSLAVASEGSEPIAIARLANQILRYGYENQSALALANALQIISENPTQAIDATKEGDFVDAPKADGKKARVSYDYETVLADAKAFAQGDANLLAVINSVDADAKGANRGNLEGPFRDCATVGAQGVANYFKWFEGKKPAEVTVSGDGATKLEIRVYDTVGRLVSHSKADTGDCYVRWLPMARQRYLIRIVNLGGEANSFVVLTN